MIGPLLRVVRYRELLAHLVRRELKARYKQTFLGVAWQIGQPLMTIGVFTIVLSVFAKIPSDGFPYPVFFYCAMLPWSFFAASLTGGAQSFVTYRALLTKVYFPRELLAVSTLVVALVDFGFGVLIFIAMMVYWKMSVTLSVLSVIPLFALQIVFTQGLILGLASVNVFFRDVGPIVTGILPAWMFLSPVIYPLHAVPEHLRSLYLLNPMASLVDGYRQAILYGTLPNLERLTYVSGVSIITLVFGYAVLRRLESVISDVI